MVISSFVRALLLPSAAAAAMTLMNGGGGDGNSVPFTKIVAAAVPIATGPITSVAHSARSAAGTDDATLHSDRHADGLFYVRVLVNGTPIRFMVDTGASYTVLTNNDARAAGIVLEGSKFSGRVSTVGGVAPMAWTSIDRVELAGHDVRGLKAVVVRDGLGVSLLGQNMLAKLNSVTLRGDDLHLR